MAASPRRWWSATAPSRSTSAASSRNSVWCRAMTATAAFSPCSPICVANVAGVSLIALEEHYAWDPASDGNVVATWLKTHNTVGYDRLYDRVPLRLEQMDATGIDFQILSLFDP